MRVRRRTVAVVGLMALSVGACVSSVEVSEEFATEVEVKEPPDVAFPDPPPDEPRPDAANGPAPFQVTTEQASVEAAVFTSCWTEGEAGMCADGIPQPERVVIAADEQVTVMFKGSNGELSASWSTATDADQQPLEVTAVADGEWIVDLSVVSEAEYVLWLSWVGDEGDAYSALTVRNPNG